MTDNNLKDKLVTEKYKPESPGHSWAPSLLKPRRQANVIKPKGKA